MKSVPIPGDILRTTVFLGLSFTELVVLGTIPAVVVLPSLFISQIPLVVSVAIVIVMLVVVLALIAQAPDGQTPLEWAPATLQRRLSPNKYTLKPKQAYRSRPKTLNVVHTAEQIQEETADGYDDIEINPRGESGEATIEENQPTEENSVGS